MGAIIIINNFIHDFAAGVWLAGTILILLLSKEAEKGKKSSEFTVFFKNVFIKFSWVIIISIVIVILGGVIRLLTYKYYAATNPFAGQKVALLVAKHILLVSLVAVSIYILRRLSKKWESVT